MEEPTEGLDYHDEISDEQLAALREKVAGTLAEDGWVVIDGPAW